jgi:hypothetical protein
MSRKPWEPSEQDRKLVEKMAACGVPQDQIAAVLGRDPKTLRKYCAEELDHAATRANANVAASLYQAAIKGNVTAQIFWCKTRLGWKEVQQVEHSGKIESITVNVVRKEPPK